MKRNQQILVAILWGLLSTMSGDALGNAELIPDLFSTFTEEGMLSTVAEPTKLQIRDSALGYKRSWWEANHASEELESMLSLQIYLAASTPDYYQSHADALQAATEITSYFAFQTYLTLLTSSYYFSHRDALAVATELRDQGELQQYLHLIVIGRFPMEALEQVILRR